MLMLKDIIKFIELFQNYYFYDNQFCNNFSIKSNFYVTNKEK